MATSAQHTNECDWVRPYRLCLHSLKQLQSCEAMAIGSQAIDQCGVGVSIRRGDLVEGAEGLLDFAALCVHIDEGSEHSHVPFDAFLIDIGPNPAGQLGATKLANGGYDAGHGGRIWLDAGPLHLVEQCQSFLCPSALRIACDHHGPRDQMALRRFIKQLPGSIYQSVFTVSRYHHRPRNHITDRDGIKNRSGGGEVASIHVANDHGVPGDGVLLGHFVEQLTGGEHVLAKTGVRAQKCVVGDEIRKGHFVEDAAGEGELVALAVHVDESVGHGEVTGEAGAEEAGMELGTGWEVAHGGAGVEDEGEGEIVRGDGEGGHAGVEAEGEARLGERANGAIEEMEGGFWSRNDDGENRGRRGKRGVVGEEEGGKGVVDVEEEIAAEEVAMALLKLG